MTDTKQSEIDFLRQRVAELERGNNTALGMLVEYGNKLDAANTRVAELEADLKSAQDGCNTHLNSYLKCLEELAALKQQGEPVGYFVNVNLPGTRPNYQQVTDDCAGDSDVVRLYTEPLTCFSAADMADAQAKAFIVGNDAAELRQE